MVVAACRMYERGVVLRLPDRPTTDIERLQDMPYTTRLIREAPTKDLHWEPHRLHSTTGGPVGSSGLAKEPSKWVPLRNSTQTSVDLHRRYCTTSKFCPTNFASSETGPRMNYFLTHHRKDQIFFPSALRAWISQPTNDSPANFSLSCMILIIRVVIDAMFELSSGLRTQVQLPHVSTGQFSLRQSCQRKLRRIARVRSFSCAPKTPSCCEFKFDCSPGRAAQAHAQNIQPL